MKYKEAVDYGLQQYEKYVSGKGSKEDIVAARPAREQTETALNTAIAEKKAYEEQYQLFCKLIKVGRKEVPLSEAVGCIESIVVDTERKITVRWHQ